MMTIQRAFFSSLIFCLFIFSSVAHAATLSGRVFGPDVKPIPDAEVVVTNVSLGKAEQPVTQTDAQGRFTISVADVPAEKQITASVMVFAPGLSVGSGILGFGQDFILLDRATELRGSVTNEQGEPVANARVRLKSIFSIDHMQPYGFENEAVSERFTTRTDANGQWRFANVPSNGRATVRLEDDDYVYAYEFTEVSEGVTMVEPLVARPAASIAGKVVGAKGQAIAGAEITAEVRINEKSYSSNALSGDDGSYLVTGLPEGAVTIMARLPSGEVLPGEVTGVAAKVSQTVQAPNIVMAPGITLEAKIVDSETGEPLQGGRFYARTAVGSIISPRSDENGRVVVQVRPGKTSFSFNRAPHGYSTQSYIAEPREIEVSAAAAPPVVTFRMTKGQTLTGTALDENGQPATGARIINFRGGNATTVDENGRWTLHNVVQSAQKVMNAGNALYVGNAPIKTDPEWSIVQPLQVSAPTSTPLELRLRRAPLFMLAGRVVTPDGKAVSGAVLEAKITEKYSSVARTIRPIEKLSDEQGRFVFSRLKPDNQITLTADKPGFRYRSGGQLTKTSKGISVSDFVMEPLVAIVKGRVLDSKGAPAEGVHLLALESDSFATIVTDATGNFELKSLPSGPVTVMAARGKQEFAQARLNASTTNAAAQTITLVTKKPPAVSDTQRAIALIQSLRSDMMSGAIETLATVDPDRALEISKRELSTMTLTPEGNIAGIITALARRDRHRAEEWGWPKLGQITRRESQIKGALSLGIAIAESNPTRAKEILQKVRGLLMPNDTEQAKATYYVRMAALATRLKDPAAEEFMQLALKNASAFAERFYAGKPQQQRDVFYSALRPFVKEIGFSADLTEQIFKLLPEPEQIRALSEAIPHWAATDPDTARRLLQQLGAFLEAPAAAEEAAKTSSPQPASNLFRAWRAFVDVAPAVIKAIGEDDPAGALAIARQADVKAMAGHVRGVDMVLALAASFQKPEVAAPLFREALSKTPRYTTWYFMTDKERPSVLSLAYGLDPKLGQQLFAEMRDEYLTSFAEMVRRRQNIDLERAFTALAFHYARIEPAQSRLWLEKEFHRLKTSTILPEGHDGTPPPGAPKMPPLAPDAFLVADAMKAVDIDRALEMANAIPVDELTRQSYLGGFINYLLTPERVR